MNIGENDKVFILQSRTITTFKTILVSIALSIIIILIILRFFDSDFISRDGWETSIYCGVVLVFTFNIISLLSIKKTRICINGNDIQFFRSNKPYYKGSLDKLQYIDGADINSNALNVANTIFVFDDRKIMLSTLDTRGYRSSSAKALLECIAFIVYKLNLEKIEREDILFH